MAEKDLATRAASAASIRAKHPDRIPVIVDKRTGDSSLPDIDKVCPFCLARARVARAVLTGGHFSATRAQKKFLVPSDLTIGQFMYVIRKRIKLTSEQAIFLFVSQGTLPPSVNTLQQVYDQYHDPDGFLYMTYSGENVFGH